MLAADGDRHSCLPSVQPTWHSSGHVSEKGKSHLWMTKDHTGRAGQKSGRVGWRRLSGNMGCARQHSVPPLTTSHKHGSSRGLQTPGLSQCPCCARSRHWVSVLCQQDAAAQGSAHPCTHGLPRSSVRGGRSSCPQLGNGHDAPRSTQHCSSEPFCHRHARTALIQIQAQLLLLPHSGLALFALITAPCTAGAELGRHGDDVQGLGPTSGVHCFFHKGIFSHQLTQSGSHGALQE